MAAEPTTDKAGECAPADSFWSCRADGAVKLHVEEGQGPASLTPATVTSALQRAVNLHPEHTALAVKRGGEWVRWNFREYQRDCRAAAKALIKLGLEPYHGVGIIGFNSPEWFMSAVASIMAGGFATGMYTTNTPEACQYVAENCAANVIVVENDAQLAKILKVWDSLPSLKAVVQYSGELAQKRENVYTWAEFMTLGSEVSDGDLDGRIAAQAPNKCCTLIYTSGTTGNPKGVMLSHDNLIWVSKMVYLNHKLRDAYEVVVSYLPLSHIAAQVLDIYVPIVACGTTYFAQPDALKGSLVATLKEVRPTAFFGVPRVWEKIHEKLKAISGGVTGIKRKMAVWAKGVGYRGNMNMMVGRSVPWGWTLANMLVFKKVRLALGLDRAHTLLSGAAPITRETLDYFFSINLPVLEIYGMSESTGPHTVGLPDQFRIGSVGKEFPGITTKIAEPDKDGNGEVLFFGRHVFMGYLNQEEKTRNTIDEEGYLHSEDIGRKDENGFLYITGRIKELLITAGGENIPPVPIEDEVKKECQLVSNSMLIGDKRKFLSILLTLKVTVDEDSSEPSSQLTDEAIKICKELGSSATTVEEVKGDGEVGKFIQKSIDQANKAAPSRAQKIQKWTILDKDFSIPGGELGPTLKLRRSVVHKMYTDFFAHVKGGY